MTERWNPIEGTDTIRAVIIAGGLGTRMRPLSLSRPKPLIPIANRPLLEYQVGILRNAGITEIVFGTNYLAEQIVEHFGDGSRFGVRMSYRVEPQPMDTAGAIRYAVDGLPPKTCVVFNGDTLHDFDLGDLIGRHRSRNADVTITLYRVNRPHPFGVVPLDANNRVTSFLEPTREQKLAAQQGTPMEGSDLINAGLYLLEPDVLAKIPMARHSIEREFFPALLREGAAVYGQEAGHTWTDIGRPALLLEATHALLSGTLDLAELISGTPMDGSWVEDGAEIHPRAQIEAGCHIGAGAVVGEDALLRNHTVVGPGCVVGPHAILDKCILMEQVMVGNDSRLTRCIVDRACNITDNVTASESVIAAGSTISSFSTLGETIA